MFNTKAQIAEDYDKLFDQHEEPFKSIMKSVTDVSLADHRKFPGRLQRHFKALPQISEISNWADQNISSP
jgi:hypothetical protein